MEIVLEGRIFEFCLFFFIIKEMKELIPILEKVNNFYRVHKDLDSLYWEFVDKVLRRDCYVDDYPQAPGIYGVTAWVVFFDNTEIGIRILNDDEGEKINGNFMHKYNFVNLILKNNEVRNKEEFYSFVCENLQTNKKLKGTFEHELTHYITRKDKNISRSGYKRAKDGGYKKYIKHPQELPSQIMGMISNLDTFIDENPNAISYLYDKNQFEKLVLSIVRPNIDFPNSGLVPKLKNPNLFDKLVSFIKPIGEFFRTDTDAKNKMLKALNQYRVGKLKELES